MEPKEDLCIGCYLVTAGRKDRWLGESGLNFVITVRSSSSSSTNFMVTSLKQNFRAAVNVTY